MIAATDPRHGERAGYVAGCREECCRVPHIRYQKRSTLRRLREGSQYVDPTPLLNRINEWARYGVTPRALGLAAGLAEDTLQQIRRGLVRPEKDTARKALAVTWDTLEDSALVNADLTRHRIYSLMAAGHPLTWICAHVNGLNVGGKWRDQEKVTLGLARGVMALYDSAPTWGPSKGTASKARNKGYQPPAAWDDPGIPAMPQGWQPARDKAAKHLSRDDVDEVVVLRALGGERLPMTRAERVEVVTRARNLGWSYSDIEERCGISKVERYIDKEDAA